GPVDARSNQSGSITELISQLKKMLSARVLDPVTQTSMHIDYAVAVVSQHLSAEAKRLWENEFEGERRVLLWDAANLAEIIFKARIWPRLPISFRISSNA
ncbi:MAG TPA: hypothetical protein PLZ55_02610, partial [bacterium]|nr:hypothetical protein [bacterium]